VWNSRKTTIASSGYLPVSPYSYVALRYTADFFYKTTDHYASKHERCIVWNDQVIGIQWLVEGDPVLSAKGLHST